GPGVGGGEERDGREQEAVEASGAIDQGHGDFTKPLVRKPHVAGVPKAEGVLTDHVVLFEDETADDGMPERAGIVDHPRSASGEQNNPDYQKDAGFGGPEAEGFAGRLCHLVHYRHGGVEVPEDGAVSAMGATGREWASFAGIIIVDLSYWMRDPM